MKELDTNFQLISLQNSTQSAFLKTISRSRATVFFWTLSTARHFLKTKDDVSEAGSASFFSQRSI
jgi:hypothetical protein